MRHARRNGGGGRQGARCALALVAFAATACAAREPVSLADRLITEAPPGVELPELLPGWSAGVTVPAEAPETLELPPIQSKTSELPAIETTDPELAAALAAIDDEPTADAYRRAGEAYRRVRVFDQAYRHLSRAVALAPQDARNRDALTRLWRDSGEDAAALPEAYRAVHFAPDSATVQNTLGTVLLGLGQTAEAVRAFARAATLAPGAAWAWSNLCYASWMAGHVTDARTHCGRALAIDADFQPARNNLGLVLAAIGDLEGAEREFGAAGAAAAEFNMGVVHLARREFALARDRFAAALAADPSLWRAQEMAAAVERLDVDSRARVVGRYP